MNISNQTAQEIDQKVTHTVMAGMFILRIIKKPRRQVQAGGFFSQTLSNTKGQFEADTIGIYTGWQAAPGKNTELENWVSASFLSTGMILK